jgi:hypothetical protein
VHPGPTRQQAFPSRFLLLPLRSFSQMLSRTRRRSPIALASTRRSSSIIMAHHPTAPALLGRRQHPPI